MARNPSHFARGSAVYECRCCARNTRATGRGDNENVQLCAECYDLSGEENIMQDGGEPDAKRVEQLILALQAKGGDVDGWLDTFGDVLGTKGD